MAVSKKALALLLSGSIGNVVVYEMNGKMVVRSKPSVKRKKATGQQKDAQNLFGKVMKVMGAAKKFLNTGFGNQKGHSAFHSAMSANMLRFKEDKNFDFSKLIVSQGDLLQFGGLNCIAGHNNELVVSWEDVSSLSGNTIPDSVSLLVYNSTTNQCEFAYECGHRDKKEARLQLTGVKTGDLLEVYICLLDLRAKLLSDKYKITQSVWAGRIQWV